MDVKNALAERPEQVMIIDVRNAPPEILKDKIQRAVEIPESQISSRLTEIPKDKEIILYCCETWCSLGVKAAIVLLENGFRAKELYSGIAAWKGLNLPTEKVAGIRETVEVPCSC